MVGPMPTPHIEAPDDAFAPIVLMPGDPLRATHIAENYLDDAVRVTNVRAAAGFTGSWEGVPVSVMTSGMGAPSAAIYVTELIRHYNVKRLIRVGTAGVYSPDIALRSIVAASDVISNSCIPEALLGPDPEIVCSATLLTSAQTAASDLGFDLHTGTIYTSDMFYDPDEGLNQRMADAGVLGVEMEAAAIYSIAAAEGVDALALITMTDHLVTGERLSSQDRQTSLDEMIRLSLRTAVIDSAGYQEPN